MVGPRQPPFPEPPPWSRPASAGNMFNATNIWNWLRPAPSRNERREAIRRLIFHPHLSSRGTQSPSGEYERDSSAPDLAHGVENRSTSPHDPPADWSQRGPDTGIPYFHARDQLTPPLPGDGKDKYQHEDITEDARANTQNPGPELNKPAPAAGLLHPRPVPDLPSSRLVSFEAIGPPRVTN
jgi:hypothetical protein